MNIKGAKRRRRILAVGLACAALLLALRFTTRRDLHDGISYSTAFYDRSHQPLRLELAKDQIYRLWTPLAKLPPQAVEATLLLEDRYFYLHPGVNPLALARTVWQSLRAGRTIGGASTLTMQLARLRYHLKTRTLRGKLQQIAAAVGLELRYSKKELLEAYLNLAPYGGNIEGMGAASEIYFQKRAQQLTLGESLLLTVLPQSPTRRGPPASPSDALAPSMARARDRLFTRWLQVHPEDRQELTEVLLQRRVRRAKQMPFFAPHFTAELAASAPPGAVVTTLDLGLQRLVERQVQHYVEAKTRTSVHNAAALLVDTTTMGVVAAVGSADFHNAAIQGENNGTRARRSPGSTLKPFIYGLAMDQGLVHPLTLVKDAPTGFGEWRPENFDRDFTGPLTVHDALIRSRNVPAIHLAAQLKAPSLYEFLRAAGVRGLREERIYGLALALGGAEMTMEELVQLYAMLANTGSFKPLRKLAADPPAPGRSLLTPEASELIVGILRDNPRPFQGYESRWVAGAQPVAWKTGTSFAFRDAWAIGLVGPYALAVWLGNFNGDSNPAFVGLDLAGPLFFHIVDALKARGLPPVAVKGLTRTREVRVCALSGQIPGPHCPHTALTSFIPGVSPIRICDIHRALSIDDQTGLRSCPEVARSRAAHQEVMEFWSSDLLQLFRQAGLPRRTPPAWHPGCEVASRSYQGRPPRITSPSANLTYHVRSDLDRPSTLALQAVTEADATQVYWFLDQAFIGAVPAGKPFFWTPKPGRYAVRAVDDIGRAAQTSLRVELVD